MKTYLIKAKGAPILKDQENQMMKALLISNHQRKEKKEPQSDK
jgi:hypothetical protein